MPRFAAGNGDVDIEMLEVADFALVIVHDDADREYAVASGAERILDVAAAKDWQQVAVVTRMAADLSMPVEVVACPTVRSPILSE